MNVAAAIAKAEALLPGCPAPDEQLDPRWQAIIEVSEFIDSQPHQVWAFARKWASHQQEDLQVAIATCVLEHLLEHDFATFFPLVSAEARASAAFARTLAVAWLAEPAHANQLRHLLASIRHGDA